MNWSDKKGAPSDGRRPFACYPLGNPAVIID